MKNVQENDQDARMDRQRNSEDARTASTVAPTSTAGAVGRWRRGDHTRHPSLHLFRTWVHSNGAEVWQGRPFETKPKDFVYRVVLPGGGISDHQLLNDAKNCGGKTMQPPMPTPPACPECGCRHWRGMNTLCDR